MSGLQLKTGLSMPTCSAFEDHDRLGSPESCIVQLRTGAKFHETLIRFFSDEQHLRFSLCTPK